MIKKFRGKTLAFKLKLLAVILVLLVITLTVTAFAATVAGTYTVDIYEDGTVTRVETSKQDAKSILSGMKIALGENDRLDLSGFKAGEDSSIVIYRYSTLALTTNDGTKSEIAFAGTVGDLLESRGVKIADDDVINYPTYTVVTDGMNVVVQKACLVKVFADGEEKEIRVGFVTVSDALDKAGVALGEDDEVSPSADTDVKDGMKITVKRVVTEERTETEVISYSTTTKESGAYAQGTRQVTTKGKNGSKEVTYVDKYVDGVLVESTVKDEEIIEKPVDEVVTVGIRPAVVSVSASGKGAISELSLPSKVELVNGVPKNYKSVVTGKAASYTASKGAGTASGRKVKPGYIAVDPEQFPYGTELYIVATDGTVYGYAIAADTGGFVHNGSGFTIDLFMNTYEECAKWGARDVIIYVL
ncbi:MAG: ubiquitin-like domain-containing protein [Clostridiales bacterium]|nr:ubiquitin-like domain-containing protein [Clostridiales bacterium]